MKQKGYIKIVLVVFALLIGVMMFPLKLPTQTVTETEPVPEVYCRDMVDDPNAPTVEAPSYTATEVLTGTARKYRLIKKNVAIDRSITLNQTPEHHYFPDFKQQYTDPEGKNYLMRIPQGLDGSSYKLPSEVGTEDSLKFADYGLLYLFHADGAFDLRIDEKFPRPGGGEPLNIVLADIYKAVETPALPEWVVTCYDQGVGGTTNSILGGGGGVYTPPQQRSEERDQMQLEWFLFTKNRVSLEAWWVPHCKPAVYLYPEKKEMVNVKVHPLGELGYTDPVYDPVKGWTVFAEPNGNLEFGIWNLEAKNYSYLYYESRLLDSEIRKPQEGWVAKGSREMGELFDRVLPKLGLNQKEAADFKDYWLKQLPESPYYFVGLIDKSERDRLERLEVTPNPETSIRFSLFFEPIDQPRPVNAPVINTPKRDGFTLVDWGGMIKLQKDTPFTCSQ